MLTRFMRARGGNVAAIFALSALPLFGATGAAVDFSRAFQQRSLVQDALDSAVLAANRLIGTTTDDKVKGEAKAFYTANLAGHIAPPPALEVTIDGGTVTASTTLHVKTHLLGIFGHDEIAFDLLSRSTAGAVTYEVAMVLDNSGSMSGSKIAALRDAAKSLTKTLFEVNKNNPKPDPIKIGLVPFAASVNVGKEHATAAWMDTGVKSSRHTENASPPVSRFDLFKAMGTEWGGCVEARPMPYDIEDTTPTTANPETLFVPMFAADEPDTPAENRSGGFSNSYISDTGACGTPPANQTAAQSRTCKYAGAKPAAGKAGPNANCTTAKIMPLTKSQNQVETAIGGMVAGGMTNIHDGIMWGWALLSPTAPFTEGRAYGTKDNRKILIVMTDGANTYSGYNNTNQSMYGAWGFMKDKHLGIATSSESQIVAKMDERTLKACANAKTGTGIAVYTIAFQLEDDAAKKILKDCASEPTMAFDAKDNGQLLSAFQSIANDIAALRLAN